MRGNFYRIQKEFNHYPIDIEKVEAFMPQIQKLTFKEKTKMEKFLKRQIAIDLSIGVFQTITYKLQESLLQQHDQELHCNQKLHANNWNP